MIFMAKQILSCDWGTSGFRLRLVNVEDAAILNEKSSDQGIASVYNEWVRSNQPETERVAFYKHILRSVLTGYFKEDIQGVPIIISGMASSTIGMKALAYNELPFELKSMDVN